MHLPLPTLLAPLLLSSASARTTLTTLFVDGANQGDGVCIRMSDANQAGNSIEPISSPEIACGYGGETGVARVCPANASSTLTFEFRKHPENTHSTPFDSTLKGPCAVYMKKVPDATANNTAAGNGWFKISESGFDKHAGKWCTEKIADNNGHLSVKIPQDIRGGYYLVRSELLSLHDAAGKKPNPEFFVGCAQVFVNGSGSAKKPSTVHIGEGTYNLSIPGLTFDVNKAMTLPYPMFGPPVYKSGSGGSAQSGSAGVSASGDQTETGTAKATGTVPGLKTLSETSAVQTGTAKPANAVDGSDSESSDADSSDDEGGLLSDWDISSDSDDEDEDSDDEDETQTLGLKPKGCVLVRDNWCGIEVPSYSDEKGCWASSKNCWQQSDICSKTAPATGSAHCSIWQKKCRDIDDSCMNSVIINGPPNKGKDLTPTPLPLTRSTVVSGEPHRKDAARRELNRRAARGHGH